MAVLTKAEMDSASGKTKRLSRTVAAMKKADQYPPASAVPPTKIKRGHRFAIVETTQEEDGRQWVEDDVWTAVSPTGRETEGYPEWTLRGEDGPDQDGYPGLHPFARLGELKAV